MVRWMSTYIHIHQYHVLWGAMKIRNNIFIYMYVYIYIYIYILMVYMRCATCSSTRMHVANNADGNLSLQARHLHIATHFNTLQHTATHCNTLQHTATHCNTPQRNVTISVFWHATFDFTCTVAMYSQLQIGWHRFLRLFLKTFNLVPGVPGFSWDSSFINWY